jgi:hypothetical protein
METTDCLVSLGCLKSGLAFYVASGVHTRPETGQGNKPIRGNDRRSLLRRGNGEDTLWSISPASPPLSSGGYGEGRRAGAD